jgi:hypothetical protein
MRTTLDIDADLLERVRTAATRAGRSFREELNRVIHRGLASPGARGTEAYLTPTFDLGPVRPGIELDRALALAGVLADEETGRKLALRK